jgi:hypothetical protein
MVQGWWFCAQELPKMPCRCDANRAFAVQEKTANVFVPVHKTRARVWLLCDANRAFAVQEKTANLFVPVHKTRARVWLLARSSFLVMHKLVLPSGTVCKIAVLLHAFSARPLQGRENIDTK